MDSLEIMKYVDHTLLSPVATLEQIDKLCLEAIKYNAASVCIPQSYVEYVAKNYKNLKITTVIGFPLGYNIKESKILEAKKSIDNGADEIDMVINITDLKNRNYDKIENEIRDIKKVLGDNVLKVIIETCYLTEDEKIKMCELVSSSGADFIKTSTGFGTGGATIEDVELFNKHISDNVKIKAAGGIRTKDDMIKFIELGCSRLGTSSAIKILFE